MMILLTVLNWFQTRKAFVDKHVGTTEDPEEIEDKKQVAIEFWNGIDANDHWMLIAMIVITALFCYLYFIPYNNRPGRHYKPSHWFGFYVFAVIATLLSTFGMCCLFVNYSYDEGFVWTVSLINSALVILFYFLISIWFWKKSSSNAYPLI